MESNRTLRLMSAGVVAAAALVGTLTYLAYRNENATGAAGAPTTSHNSASVTHGGKNKVATPPPPPSAAAAEAEVKPKPAMTLPPEASIPPGERAKAFELIDALKQQANLAFQERRYEDAMRRYQDCLEVTAVLGAHDVEAVKVDQVVRANVIMTLIQMQDYEDARLVATMLLQDPGVALPEDLKVKVLYRRGLASKALGDREAALSDYKAALHFSKDQKNEVVSNAILALEKGR